MPPYSVFSAARNVCERKITFIITLFDQMVKGVMTASQRSCYTTHIMYLAVDIGGTKTLVASLTNEGVITEKIRFETPKNYDQFIMELACNVDKLSTKDFVACGVGAPGRIDRHQGVALAMGNLDWRNVPLSKDMMHISGCHSIIENDANLAGLSEAMLVKDRYNRVLYVTISTGIGTGIIIDQKIDPDFADSEGGQVMVERAGKLMTWEDLVSGRAIVKHYGKMARDITDSKTWNQIAHDIALGLIDLITIIQPEIIILGGGVDTYFDRFQNHLVEALKRYETPLVPIPTLAVAKRPEDAVLYGCYDLAKAMYGSTRH